MSKRPALASEAEFATDSKPGEMTAPRWGVPDWRDESKYPDQDTPIYEWHWQFLRRRPDYREYWLKHAKAHFENCCSFAVHVRRNGDPDYMMPEWYRGWVVEGGVLGGYTSTLDPAFPHYRGGVGVFPGRLGGRSVWRAEWQAHSEADRAGLVSIEFDLNEPLRPQLDCAEKRLEADQLERIGANPLPGRRHTGKWATYLRVIDARDDRQSWSVIGRHILKHTRNNPQAARQVWEQAQRLMFKVGS